MFFNSRICTLVQLPAILARIIGRIIPDCKVLTSREVSIAAVVISTSCFPSLCRILIGTAERGASRAQRAGVKPTGDEAPNRGWNCPGWLNAISALEALAQRPTGIKPSFHDQDRRS